GGPTGGGGRRGGREAGAPRGGPPPRRRRQVEDRVERVRFRSLARRCGQTRRIRCSERESAAVTADGTTPRAGRTSGQREPRSRRSTCWRRPRRDRRAFAGRRPGRRGCRGGCTRSAIAASGRSGQLAERDQLVRDLPAPEGEQLDQHNARPYHLHGREDRSPAALLHSVDAPATVAADQTVSLRIETERGKRNDLDAGGRRGPLG